MCTKRLTELVYKTLKDYIQFKIIKYFIHIDVSMYLYFQLNY